MKKISVLFSLPILIFLFGCASGAYVITGEARKPVLQEDVKIYPKFPPEDEYEIIGLVTAESNSRLTAQWDMDAAVNEAKKRAGLMGANGIVFTELGSSQKSFLLSSFLFSRSGRTISGTAIYVEKKAPPYTGVFVKKTNE
ncbi:hypothetical protein [Treponema zioleckii]|uniref:hypothetical protein n=1 Tax=Treponema zioleckii TaxID=331680 RepID=UPI00168AF120|nr:hypothetical protein [Treponema zioleckii]